MIDELNEWAVKVSENKKNRLDREMFDDLMKIVRRKLDNDGYEHVKEWLEERQSYKGDGRAGPESLASNAKLVRDKLWSLKRKEDKNVAKK